MEVELCYGTVNQYKQAERYYREELKIGQRLAEIDLSLLPLMIIAIHRDT